MNFKEILDEAVANHDSYGGVPWVIEETEALDGAEEIKDEIIGTSRWANLHRVIFEHDGRFWAVEYREPATEMQEWDTDGYRCYEVQKVKKTIFDYVPIPKAD